MVVLGAWRFLMSELPLHGWSVLAPGHFTLEMTQGQMDGFISQLPFKCYLPQVASVGD